jgi:hypothetical protein
MISAALTNLSLLAPEHHARMIAANIRFDGMVEAESRVIVMLRLCMMKLLPKLSYRNH